MIAIIDYDAGNIKSVEKALLYLGQEVKVTGDKEEILSADKVICPAWERSGMRWQRSVREGWRA